MAFVKITAFMAPVFEIAGVAQAAQAAYSVRALAASASLGSEAGASVFLASVMIVQAGKATLMLVVLMFPVWIAARSFITVHRRRRGQPTSMNRELLLAAFFLYLVLLAAVTIVPLPMSRARTPRPDDVNLVPLVPLLKCFAHQPSGIPESRRFCLQNLVGNVALFLPLGILLPLVFDRLNLFRRVLVVALLASVGIELTQWLSRSFGSYRYVDINDVILNVLGACLGYACYAVARRYLFAKS
jgi:glycopeptide antibiotics resistance protein